MIEARIASYGGAEINFNLMAICADQAAALQSRLSAAQAGGESEMQILDLQSRLAEELDKRKRWDFDNALRRHNHLGLVHALLVALAKQGKLQEAVEESRKVTRERRDKEIERRKMAGMAA